MSKAKKTPNSAAVIEFSSNNVRMIIVERVGKEGGDGDVRQLGFLERPLSIGKDTFTHGKLGFDKVGAACSIVQNYLQEAAAYGVPKS
ncbi:MAG: hypothetical protein FWC95_04095, partial [Defluviitaleaceae bacterium]|nr:hypothetical protein [Defluviitaleaceae bacterium]